MTLRQLTLLSVLILMTPACKSGSSVMERGGAPSAQAGSSAAQAGSSAAQAGSSAAQAGSSAAQAGSSEPQAGAPAGPQAGVNEGPSPYAALIQERARSLIGEDGGVGAVVVLVTPAHTEVLGLGARRLGGAPVDGQTVFQIASITKALTGLMLASMIESGSSLQPSDPVNDHLQGITAPSFEGAPITLEQLATHYSSLPNFPNNLSGPMWSPGQGYTRERLAEYLSGAELLEAPGTRYEYSNLGYGLLALSLSDSAGLSSYEELATARLINPLSLSRTGLNRAPYLERVRDNIAQGYGARDNGRPEVGYTSMGALVGSGELFSTGEDMAVILRVMCGLAPYPVQGAVERAIEPRAQGMGARISYGWDVSDEPKPVWSKSGLTTGFTAFAAFTREPQVGVAILSNLGRHREIQGLVLELIEAAAALP